MRPGVAPEMEGVLREAEADAAPTGTYVTPQASEAFDDFNPEQALEEDIAQEQRVPQTWRELDTEDLQVLSEANRAKDNPIWQAQFKELERREAADEAAATEVEEFETIGLEQARLETQKVLEEIIKNISNRTFQIKNSIEWHKFQSGFS